MLLIPARYMARYFRHVVQTSGSVDEKVVLTNFIEDTDQARAYILGTDSFEVWKALAKNEIHLYSYAICAYDQAARPKTRCIYGRTTGQFSKQDWWMMRGAVTSSLQDESQAQRLDPDSVRLPQPCRAAILIGSFHQKSRGIYIFNRVMTVLQGLVLLSDALDAPQQGLRLHDLLSEETTH